MGQDEEQRRQNGRQETLRLHDDDDDSEEIECQQVFRVYFSYVQDKGQESRKEIYNDDNGEIFTVTFEF